MFKTAGGCSVRCVFSALSIVSLTALLGACANSSPPDPGGPKSWKVENVASKSTAELYADLIKPGVFERSSSKVIDGYTVESGNLLMPDKSVGSLVTVRSSDGSLTSVIEEPDKRGLLLVNNKGESSFTPSPPQDYSKLDTLVENAKSKTVAPKPTVTAGPYIIDMFIGYSRSAANIVGNVQANALAQVESVNLALRNSRVTDVSLRLVGTQVVEQNYPIAGSTLDDLPRIFNEGIRISEPDMIYGIFSGHPGDTAVGWAFVGGRAAIGNVYGEAFRHEVGHNAGGGHCHEPGGGYNFGFNNGKSSTAQCGNESPYYSTPSVRDQHGLPLGDAATADMARVWRENAQRLSSYAPPFKGGRMSLVSIGDTVEANLELRMPANYQAGVVALDESEGPTKLAVTLANYTRLTVKLKDHVGNERAVYLRAERVIGTCKWYAMNAYVGCPFSGHAARDLNFKLTYNKTDNPLLPPTIFTGELRLEVRNLAGSWVSPIVALISIGGSH